MNNKWWKNEVVYQIYPKSFKDSNGDGIGDINGIIEKLDYLENLGITMIWICPIFKSPMVDNGYDISDFEDINPEFGTLEDLDNLIAEARLRGIKVVLDLVINHTSDKHPWFLDAISSKDSKYRDYYIFRESEELPNNWRSIFGGPVWEKLAGEDTFYFHSFAKEQPDLNWENPKVREDLYAMIKRWLDRGIAGFRIDSITFIKKDLDFASLPADGVDGLVSCKYKTRNRPGIEKFLNELNKEVFSKYDCVTIGEAPGVEYKDFESYIGENGYFSMIFDFKYSDIDVESGSDWFKQTNWKVSELQQLMKNSQEAIQNAGWGANFLENHDQPRSLYKYVNEAYRTPTAANALGMMFFFLRGTPFIYQGQEIGMTNFNRTSIREFDDISSVDNYYRSIEEGFSAEQALEFVNARSRDNTRTPFPWTDEQYGGFSENKPWLGMTEEYPQVNAQDNVVYEFYKKMISLFKESEYSDVIKTGTIEFIDVDPNVISYKRVLNNKEIYCVTNLSDQNIEYVMNGIKIILASESVIDNMEINGLNPYMSILFEKVSKNED